MQFLTKLTFLRWLVLFLELLLSIYDEDELTKKRNLQNVQGLFWLRFLSLSKFPMKLLFYPSNKVIQTEDIWRLAMHIGLGCITKENGWFFFFHPSIFLLYSYALDRSYDKAWLNAPNIDGP